MSVLSIWGVIVVCAYSAHVDALEPSNIITKVALEILAQEPALESLVRFDEESGPDDGLG